MQAKSQFRLVKSPRPAEHQANAPEKAPVLTIPEMESDDWNDMKPDAHTRRSGQNPGYGRRGCRRRPKGDEKTRNIIIGVVVGASTLLTVASAGAQTTQAEADRANADLKRARVAEAGPPELRMQGLVFPPTTSTREHFGYSLIVGAPYEPSAFPRETWIWVGCMSADPRVKYEEQKFGFSLVRVHALIYELGSDGSLDTSNPLSTVDTDESDEAICDLENGIDSSFIEIPRSFKPAAVTLFSVGRSTQYIEVVETVERALPR